MKEAVPVMESLFQILCFTVGFLIGVKNCFF